MHRFRLFLLSVFFLGFFWSQQINAAPIFPFDMTALSVLEEVKDSAILGIENENIYLNSEKIVVEKNGIFLSTAGDILLKLTSVSSNESGIYTRIPGLNSTVATVWAPVIQCKNCSKYFADSIFLRGKCIHCGAQN